MSLKDRLSSLDRLQQTRTFKLVASGALVVLALAAVIAYVVAVNAPPSNATPTPATLVQESADNAEVGPESLPPDATPEQKAAAERAAEARSALDATAKSIEGVLSARTDPLGVATGALVGLGLALAVVWLGIGLTYLGLILGVGLIALPLSQIPATKDLAPLIMGIVALTASFTTLMQLARLLLGGSSPVFAIARNVLAEAVRLKLSMVFIVLLIFLLAALPGLLKEDAPLRYRVQTFLQYATGGAFWLIALMVLTFSAATVAFEQRDRIIWQTMTKPVRPLQYMLGKWLGVMTLSAVLMLVCGSAIFLFTEYLRSRPALGETKAYVTATGGLSEDRLILETQVLAARVGLEPEPPVIDPAELDKEVARRIENEIKSNEFFRESPDTRQKAREQIIEQVNTAYRSVEPGQYQKYLFTGLQDAKSANRPLTFRFRIEAGGNRPDLLYKVTFVFSGSAPFVRESTLGNTHQMQISPAAINDQGQVEVVVVNGDILTGYGNPMTISLPPKDGLFISYSQGSYRANFFRVMFVLLVKLGFLSMLAIWASSFLSFPVACLMAFGVFMLAEGSNFLVAASENFRIVDDAGKTVQWRVALSQFTAGIGWLFQTYGDLKPTGKLVDGILLSWRGVAQGTIVLSVWTGALFALAVAIFRRRELATYSGQ